VSLKKIGYLLLMLCSAWLLFYQVILCVFSIANGYTNNPDPDPFDVVGYISVLLTAITSIFTLYISKQKLKQLNAEHKE
jgi:hypothetical protein